MSGALRSMITRDAPGTTVHMIENGHARTITVWSHTDLVAADRQSVNVDTREDMKA